MNKHIIDEKKRISYTLLGDVYLPDLVLPPEEEQQTVGIWGRRHLQFIKQHKHLFYTNLLTSGKLNSYLVDIDRRAEEMFSQLVKQMAECEGITEKLKAEKQMEWVGKMNNIQNRAMEIVNSELIYDNQTVEDNEAIYRSTTEEIPKIFWRFFDLYRRKEITLAQYSEKTSLSIPTLKKFLREATGKSSKTIERTKEL